jgi:hydrogenase nickel incorporation protein HypA/HybF
MHELALCQNIVDLVVEYARKEGVDRVTRVTIEVGAAAGVEPDALEFCFEYVAADTIVQGAELVIDVIPLLARCRDCACEFAPERIFSACPRCGAEAPFLLTGRELRVKSFDGE